MNAVIVMIFGFFGGIARFELGERFPKVGEFPLVTLFINWLGCFCLAFFVEKYLVSKKASERLLLGIGTGFIGSFTTFSSCMLDLANLLLRERFGLAFLYFFLSSAGGLFFVFFGIRLGQQFFGQSKEEK